jgi:hypothetical protein
MKGDVPVIFVSDTLFLAPVCSEQVYLSVSAHCSPELNNIHLYRIFYIWFDFKSYNYCLSCMTGKIIHEMKHFVCKNSKAEWYWFINVSDRYIFDFLGLNYLKHETNQNMVNMIATLHSEYIICLDFCCPSFHLKSH